LKTSDGKTFFVPNRQIVDDIVINCHFSQTRRVKYQKQTENGMEAGYSPPLGEAPLNSDVTAWRYAWKLCEATRTDVEAGASAALYPALRLLSRTRYFLSQT
jgi:hypothetical protein